MHQVRAIRVTPEASVKNNIRKVLARMGLRKAGGPPVPDQAVGWYYMPANNGMGVSGIADFMGIYRGRAFGIEAKAAGGKLTANQENRRDEMLAAQAIWLLIDPSNVNTLEEQLNGTRH